MSSDQPDTEANRCHREGCNNEGELRMRLPDWSEERYVCRRFLRRLKRGVDARTWIEAGYAVWDESGRDAPTPIEELEDGQHIRQRERLEEVMGWNDGE